MKHLCPGPALLLSASLATTAALGQGDAPSDPEPAQPAPTEIAPPAPSLQTLRLAPGNTLSVPMVLRGGGRGDDDTPEPSFTVEAPEVVELGWGWSQARSAPIPTSCIEFEPSQRDAQTSNISIEEISDSYSLAKSMDVSASVSVRAMGASVDGKASFAKSSKVSATSTSYLVTAEVLNSARYAAPARRGEPRAIRLAEWAEKLAKEDYDRFQKICGEGYVGAAIDGARAYLLSVVQTKTKTERATMRASVSGSGWGQKASAAAGTDESSASASYNRNVTFYQQGGSASAPAEQSDLPENAEEAIARIKKLATAAATAGKTFEIEIFPYAILSNFPADRNSFAEEDEHDELAAAWGAYNTLYDDLADILATPDAFVLPLRSCKTGDDQAFTCEVKFEKLDAAGLSGVEQLQDQVLAALEALETEALVCLDADEDCQVDVAALVRSPYSVYANMPVPDPAITLRGHTDFMLRDAAMARCRFGALTPGCIDNRMINAWAARTGLASHAVTDPDATLRAIGACESVSDKIVIVGDADDPAEKVVWHAPGLQFDAAGGFMCPPA